MDQYNKRDWSFSLKFVIYSMNISVCRATKCTLYSLVFGKQSNNISN